MRYDTGFRQFLTSLRSAGLGGLRRSVGVVHTSLAAFGTSLKTFAGSKSVLTIAGTFKLFASFLLWIVGKSVKWISISFVALLGTMVSFAILIMLIGNSLYATPRDAPYRNLQYQSKECANSEGWSILAKYDNDESKVLEEDIDKNWQQRFRCTLQHHLIPPVEGGERGSGSAESAATNPGVGRQLEYYLGFLEYKEDGSPHPMVNADDSSPTLVRPDGSLILGQYTALEEHFKKHDSNYVIVFVHGWRHDARIGDRNVRDARIYAAHAARFLAQRCEGGEIQFCNVTVTAIYVGWRGARVDETKLKRQFGVIGEWIGTIAAIPTLFDRKPISEEVGPSVVTALRGLYTILQSSQGHLKKMAVFGHSLGGNLLISTVRDQMVKAVNRYEPRRRNSQTVQSAKPLVSPIGDLVVLINPASEAANWTAIQRAVWSRIAYRYPEDVPGSTVEDGHFFFERTQAPILISVTAARSWPPAELRTDDCKWLNAAKEWPGPTGNNARAIWKLIEKNKGMFRSNVEYDWATFDLFPLFKFDSRPLAQTVQRYADRIANRDGPPGNACSDPPKPGFWTLLSKPIRAFASILRNLPFMNTDREQTRTIGHLDPPRPPMGNLTSKSILPFRPFGTTHELLGNSDDRDQPIDYHSIGTDKKAECPSSNWLWRTRDIKNRGDPNSHGMYWDSNDLHKDLRPAVRFRHSFDNGGAAGITRANDPFWNVRAFDTALSRHDGYLLSAFICSMQQLVLDDVAAQPPPAVPKPISDTTGP